MPVHLLMHCQLPGKRLDWGLLLPEGRPGPVPRTRERSMAPTVARSARDGGLLKA